MIVLSAEQVREWDHFTIENEPVSSIALMERAAAACVNWMETNELADFNEFYLFCGKGNNGGDGLAIARMLHESGKIIHVFILEFGAPGTPDFQYNLQLLHPLTVNISFIQPDAPLPFIPKNAILVDALLGTGIKRPVEGRTAELVTLINESGNTVVSIDLPSGLFADQSTIPHLCVKAAVTLSFQCFKPALLFAENEVFFGKRVILDIGLHPTYLKTIQPVYEIVNHSKAASLIEPRPSFAHKGKFGHALLIAGSYGKMGAAVLAAKSCLRCGPGLLSCLVPEKGMVIIQSTVPEAMAIPAGVSVISGSLPDLSPYRTIGCGPGLGTDPLTVETLEELINSFSKPMVWDADAINLLSRNQAWLEKLPPHTILTPHPKEFERLTGPAANESDRIKKAIDFAKKYQLIVVLKGHHTFIAMPEGKSYFNFSGNASMAKGGSGDILTGMLTGLLTRGYSPEHAVLLGVYLHGSAGELASMETGMESSLATDIADNIAAAYIRLTE
jgi:hydroxyethylthiazole kinase-like uncharacterized protein yjeF